MARRESQILRVLARQRPTRCHQCQQWRHFHAAGRLRGEPQPLPSPSASPAKHTTPKLPTDTLSSVKTQLESRPDPKEFKPQPLNRPIGFPFPPEPFHNLQRDMRSWTQRRSDLVSWEKHLERRQRISDELWRPYFKDWNAMRYAEGKIFASNDRLFKRELALYFPNLWGYTLQKKEADSVAAMRGMVSVVCVASRAWADAQCGTFVHERQNPELWKVLREHSDVAQTVEFNVEEGWMTRALIWAFAGSIRRKKSEGFQKYFVLKRVPESVRQVLGMINRKSGYVYLVDPECRIRWASSGNAWDGERESLVAGVKRLIEQARTARATKGAEQRATQVSSPKPAVAAAA